MKRLNANLGSTAQKLSRCFCFTVLWLTAMACVTLKRPPPEAWVRPPELSITKTSLEHAEIKLLCGRGDYDSDEWNKGLNRGCQTIAGILAAMGADVYDEEENPWGEKEAAASSADEEADFKGEEWDEDEDGADELKVVTPVRFTMAYIERDWDSDYCGWTLPFAILTFFFAPCVEDFQVFSELLLMDENDLVVERERYSLDLRKIYGVPALYFILTKEFNKSDTAKVTHRRFVKHLRNKVYTHFVRLGAAREAG